MKPKCLSRLNGKNVNNCKSWSCEKHNPDLKSKWMKLIYQSLPERFITLTVDPSVCGTPENGERLLRKNFRILVKEARRRFGGFEFCSVVSWTKAGYPHLHILQSSQIRIKRRKKMVIAMRRFTKKVRQVIVFQKVLEIVDVKSYDRPRLKTWIL